MNDLAPALDNGRYRLITRLGEGGMAVVYQSWDTRLKVWRAIKILSGAASLSRTMRKRFDAEAQTMARLRHRHILSVHDVGMDDDRPYMVMELVRGGSLVDWVKLHGRMPPRLACLVIEKVLLGLHHAHEHGVIHRDIKPHNILLEGDGNPVVADFGIAHIEDGEQRTRTGAAMGTLAYMAPEQRTSARKVDARADVYATAGTLLALVTGDEPCDLCVDAELERQVKPLPRALAAVIRRASRYDPEQRYPSALAMAEAVAGIVRMLPDDPVDVPPLSLPGLRALPPPPEVNSGVDSGAYAVLPATREASLGTFAASQHSTGFGDSPQSLVNSRNTTVPPGAGYVIGGAALGLGGLGLGLLVVIVGLAIAAAIYAGSGSPSVAAPERVPVAAPVVVEPKPTVAAVVPEKSALVETLPVAETAPPKSAAKASGEASAAKPKVEAAGVETPVERQVVVVPETPKVKEKGKIAVNSLPWGTVYLDGVEQGPTPLTLDADVGAHSVRVQASQGDVWHEQRVTVEAAGGTVRLCWDFEADAACARR